MVNGHCPAQGRALQYFPKKTDVVIDSAILANCRQKINTRPKKCLLEIDKSQKTLQYGCMTDKNLHRHDLTDEQWSVLAPILPGQKGQWGGIARDNRQFMNAVLWILRTGAPWRDLPKEFGKRGSAHQRFRR